MTNIPKNLVEQLVALFNHNTRFPVLRDSPGLQRVRDILIAAGCVKCISHYECDVVADGCGEPVASGCADCGRWVW